MFRGPSDDQTRTLIFVYHFILFFWLRQGFRPAFLRFLVNFAGIIYGLTRQADREKSLLAGFRCGILQKKQDI